MLTDTQYMEKIPNAPRIMSFLFLKARGNDGIFNFAQIENIQKNCLKNAVKLIFIILMEDLCS